MTGRAPVGEAAYQGVKDGAYYKRRDGFFKAMAKQARTGTVVWDSGKRDPFVKPGGKKQGKALKK